MKPGFKGASAASEQFWDSKAGVSFLPPIPAPPQQHFRTDPAQFCSFRLVLGAGTGVISQSQETQGGNCWRELGLTDWGTAQGQLQPAQSHSCSSGYSSQPFLLFLPSNNPGHSRFPAFSCSLLSPDTKLGAFGLVPSALSSVATPGCVLRTGKHREKGLTGSPSVCLMNSGDVMEFAAP